MRKLLFIPIFFLMVSFVAAENLEIIEVNMVRDIMVETQRWLDLQTLTNDPQQQFEILEFIITDILEGGYNLRDQDYLIGLEFIIETREPTKITMDLYLVFANYPLTFNIKNYERKQNE